MNHKVFTYEEVCSIYGKKNVFPIGTKIYNEKMYKYSAKYCGVVSGYQSCAQSEYFFYRIQQNVVSYNIIICSNSACKC